MMHRRIVNPIKKIAIAGAGPAGTSLAIRLVRKGFDVVLIERERFPRHKLCGEFISPECLEHFRDLDVSEEMLASGGDRIEKTVFYSPDGRCVDVPSDWFVKDSAGALSLSRAKMDLVLLKKARDAGVKVLEETSLREVIPDGNLVRSISVKKTDGEPMQIKADAFVDATGRARVLSKLADRSLGTQKRAGRRKWVGFKAHFENVDMKRGRCEIYFFRGGYGGLSHVEKGRVNNCFLIRADVIRECGGDPESVFRKVVLKNRRAVETLGGASRIHEWIAVSVDEFGRQSASTFENLFCVGDSAAFIDPFTGSGMLMAFESSEVLADCIGGSAQESASIGARYQVMYRKRFSKRLRVCKAMRYLAFSPMLSDWAIRSLQVGGLLRYGIARATRAAS